MAEQFGPHIVDCLMCKSCKLGCHDSYHGPTSCRFMTNHICESCKNIIKHDIWNTEDLTLYHCNHVIELSHKLSPGGDFRVGYKCKELNCYLHVCKLCMQYITVEARCREKKRKRQQYIVRLANESLKDKCARIVAQDPGLILVASTQYPLDDETWKRIHSYVPDKITSEYRNDLVESREQNNRWMFDTITKVFSMYKGI